jgi:hypothetical protein
MFISIPILILIVVVWHWLSSARDAQITRAIHDAAYRNSPEGQMRQMEEDRQREARAIEAGYQRAEARRTGTLAECDKSSALFYWEKWLKEANQDLEPLRQAFAQHPSRKNRRKVEEQEALVASHRANVERETRKCMAKIYGRKRAMRTALAVLMLTGSAATAKETDVVVRLTIRTVAMNKEHTVALFEGFEPKTLLRLCELSQKELNHTTMYGPDRTNCAVEVRQP